jgi:5'-deoxynucleotidase YfbR-like HD superfamily hydrolase
MTRLERVVALRTGGATERCHGIRHHGSYSVAAHTWGVLALLWELWPDEFARLAPTVMFHDVPEAWVGDVPAPVKRYMPRVKADLGELEDRVMARLGLPSDSNLETFDWARVRACDHLELYLWAREQMAWGNSHASCVARELERYFEETPLPPVAHDLYLEVRGGSVEHTTERVVMELST